MGTAASARRGKRFNTNGEAVFTLHFRTGRFRGVVKGLNPSRPAGGGAVGADPHGGETFSQIRLSNSWRSTEALS